MVSNIYNNTDLRSSLSKLRKEIKSNKTYLENPKLYKKLITCLDNEDPKVRKNAALLIGLFNYEDVVNILLEAYNKEGTEFVKEAYLKGCLNHNCIKYLDVLENIQTKLLESDDIYPKHIQSQLKVINQLIQKNSKHKNKLLRVQHQYLDVVLTTIPWYQFTLFEALKGFRYKPVGQGVLVRSDCLLDLKEIRNYEEMLIPLKGCVGMNMDIDLIVNNISNSSLKRTLDIIYNSNDPFYFKLIDRLKEKNSTFIRKISDGLALKNPKLLLNSPHQYEIEIILKELRPGSINAYLRLMDIERRRFTYRRSTTAFSMKPFLAATLMELAKPYLEDNSRVLDPFCGSGTLLIERERYKHPRFMMGVDIYSEGLDIAKKNTAYAGINIHYVHKDSLRLVNNEDFDEIFTDMPTREQMSSKEALTDLYDRFFKRIPRLVKVGGYIFIYTSELSLIRKNLRLLKDYLLLIEHYELIRDKKMYYFFIIKMR